MNPPSYILKRIKFGIIFLTIKRIFLLSKTSLCITLNTHRLSISSLYYCSICSHSLYFWSELVDIDESWVPFVHSIPFKHRFDISLLKRTISTYHHNSKFPHRYGKVSIIWWSNRQIVNVMIITIIGFCNFLQDLFIGEP